MIIIDSSIFIAGIIPDETNSLSESLLDRIATGIQEATVPALFTTEAANACLMALKRKRIGKAEFFDYITAIDNFPITINQTTDTKDTAYFALEHNLTFYDATYLELATRHNAPLATLDKKLGKAAKDLSLSYPL